MNSEDQIQTLTPGQIVVLSGRVCSGKSTLAQELVRQFDAVHVRTHECLQKYSPKTPNSRGDMQKLGEDLDRKTRGMWVCSGFTEVLRALPKNPPIAILDSARIESQIEGIRGAYGRRVLHIHLTAPSKELEVRYKKRGSRKFKEFKNYSQVGENATESRVDDLERIADICIDTQRNTIEDVVTRVASHMGLYGRHCARLIDIIVGGQYGSEGKGQIAAHLANEYDYLVRVGGPNAGHTVYGPPKYTYKHLPSGTLANPSATLIIGPGAVLRVPILLQEIADCKLSYERLRIDPQAMIIEDADIDKEGGLRETIGSTRQGVGFASARKIFRTVAQPEVRLARDIADLRPYIQDTQAVLDIAFRNEAKVMLEGTQGTGLSLHHGNYPFVTSRDTTVAGCLAEAGISPARVRRIVMVCRTYPIRVQSPQQGSSGGMSQEVGWSVIERRAGFPRNHLRRRELGSVTKGQRRVAEFDWRLLRKACSLNAPSDIALTFADYLDRRNESARRFEQLSEATIFFVQEVERVASAPVSLISTRFHTRSIIDRRNW